MSEAIKKWMKERRDRRFPNVARVAHFSPRAQLVTMDAYGRDDLPKAMQANDHEKASEFLATISHEMTHWADIVGTVWGRQLMSRIYDAYRALARRDQNRSESDFPMLVELYDDERRLQFPSYYQVVSNNQPHHGAKHPWIIGFSAGLEIDAYGRLDPTRPILFVRFFDHDTQKPLIRQPITVGALLETTAVASEYFAAFTYIRAKVPTDEQVVANATNSRAFLTRLYTPELTLYSAPVHLFAHFARIKDAVAAYDSAARIAHLCLNLTGLHFDKLLLPKQMAPWTEMFAAFKQREDRAFAFAVICNNLQPWQDGMETEKWIDEALKASGLPEASTILEEAVRVMASTAWQNEGFPFDNTASYLLELGVNVAKSRFESPLFGPNHSAKALGIVPPAVDGEGELINWPGNKFDFSRYDAEKMTELDWALEGYTRNLLSGCR